MTVALGINPDGTGGGGPVDQWISYWDRKGREFRAKRVDKR